MEPTLSPLQAKAADEIADWYEGGNTTPQIYRLFGYAGTGKSTSANSILSKIGAAVASLCYTGKAASVLRRKGVDATTIHKCIYKPVIPREEDMRKLREEIKKAEGEKLKELKSQWAEMLKPKFVLRDAEELEEIDLFLLDECSMVGEDIGADLMSFGKKILVLGDPAQLPPIQGGGYFTAGKPDTLLTEIHRQAADNPIIALANLVRQNRKLSPGGYGSSSVVSRYAITPDQYRAADQLIVGLNKTRAALNTKYRDLLGYYGANIPVAGDKLICLKNNHELGILNGTQWRAEEVQDNGDNISLKIQPWDEEDRETVTEKTDDGEEFIRPKFLSLRSHVFGADLKEMTWYEQKRYEQFDYGYAITCHKAQGSQWNKVFIQNESYAFKENSARWLYTAITRAAESVTVAI